MQASVKLGPIEVDALLYEFVTREALPGTNLSETDFWSGFSQLVQRFAARNAELLDKRDRLQASIDAWHGEHPGADFDAAAYQTFLRKIDYLLPEGQAFAVDTANVDPEIARVAGPQLVVPVSNARYALNAANARWGSLYDALYGTDVIAEDGGAERGIGYNPRRGARVIEFARRFLDESFPLDEGSHREAIEYRMAERGLEVKLRSGAVAALAVPEALAGFRGEPASPSAILLTHHGLHVEIQVDRHHLIGADDPAGVSDILLESAVTTIQDCEDSVAAVSAADKVTVYRNWLGLMRGTLEARLDKGKGAQSMVRRLATDRQYRTLSGADLVLPGRSLMLVRHVGHHMMSDAVTLSGAPVPETFIDLAITALAALHDLRNAPRHDLPPDLRHDSSQDLSHDLRRDVPQDLRQDLRQDLPQDLRRDLGADLRDGTERDHAPRNSRCGSMYIVKPKMHGPDEVAFADELFAATEDFLGLPRFTLKMGIMDEERRTSVNLAQCIRAAQHRVVFINTGFLDRTGDEIHTSMEAAPVGRKNDLKKAIWLDAYERQNVDIGLACGLPGHAQIGKGMWAMPDLMAEMLQTKIAHPRAGANTAWVPSPTAATLHALHYHQVDVAAVQRELAHRPRAPLDEILTPPLVANPGWTAAEIDEELNNNAQSILGYVVRWIDAGVGCSKVPDYYNVALMEDRATLRISSQHMANWLRHGICTEEQVITALERMARVVDHQNAADPAYRPMSTDLAHSIAFHAACDLIFQGRAQPNGYTEAILTARRKEKTSTSAAAPP